MKFTALVRAKCFEVIPPCSAFNTVEKIVHAYTLAARMVDSIAPRNIDNARFRCGLASIWLAMFFGLFGLLLPEPVAAEVGYSVRISTSQSRGTAPLDVQFRLLAETRPSGEIARVEVDPGDGSGVIVAHTGRGWIRSSPKHRYTRPGRFTARITLITTDGQRATSRARITVVPEKPANPAELLVVVNARGDAPHAATFKIGGDSLPFTARAARLSFGDGQAARVLPFQTLTHTYRAPGRYLARLEFRGNNGNRARAARTVTVDDAPRLRFTVAPTAGTAPVEVTVRANIPIGDIRRAGVLQDGREIIGTEQLVGRAEGRRKITITEPGTYQFELRAITQNGQRLRERRTVVVRRGEVAQGETYYEHDGGVVQLVQSGGAFEGIMRAPTVDQAVAGYDIGQVFVRGAYADRAYTALRPLNYDDPISERRRYYEDHAVQVAAGSYKVLSPNCPPQWGDYGFNVSFDPEIGQATSISGTVVYKGFMTRAERAFARARQPMPRAGITGRLIWVSEMMAMMRRFGDNSGRPDECVTSDAPEKSRPATFTRISAERAQEIGRENVNNTRDFAQRAYDGFDGPPPDDGTPRLTDPTYGEAPSSEDPVYLASGEFYETSIDLTDATVGGPGWRLQRTYRSQSPVHTSMGHGWVHNYQLALVRDGDGWRYRNENGSHEYFRPLSPGLFQSAGASRLRITADARIIRMHDGTLYTFVPTTGLADQSRLEHIESPGGARLSFSYDLAGRIVQVRNGAGNAARYSYDDDRGYLIRVEAPDGSAVAFARDADGNLTTKSDLHPVTGDVSSQIRYAYRGSGENIAPELRHNMVQVWLPGGGQQPALDIAYGEDPDSAGFDRVIEQRTGTLVERFAYGRTETADGEMFTTKLSAEGRADEVHFFTAQGRHQRTIYITADLQEIATDLLYDTEGKPAGRRYPDGAALEFSPGPAQGLVVQTRTPATGSDLPPIHWVTSTELVFGLQKAIFGPFVGAVPTTLAEIEEKRRVTRIYDYEEAGSGASQYLIDFGLAADDPALGDVNADGTTDQAAGRLVQEVKHSGGHETEITNYIWNDDGSLSRILRADGSATRFDYSDTGLLVQVAATSPQGAETTEAVYDWDASGGLIGARVGSTGYVGIERDALGRLVKTTRANGQSRSLIYDSAGRISAERLGEQKAAEFAYDGFGRVVEIRRWADEDDPVVETYAYDAFGRVISATDPAGTWSREIDLFGRTSREFIPNGEALTFDYEAERRLISESGLGWRHQHAYDGHGRHVETVTQSGDVISFTYDDGSRPIARTVMRDGKLVNRTLLERDSDGDLIGVSASATDDQQIALPLGGENVSVGVHGPDLFSGSFQRDLMGRITGFRSNDGATWKSQWDSASRLTSI